MSYMACDSPFSTREPEEPEERNPSSYTNPIFPETVFRNLQFAFSERNVESYMQSFVDSSRSERRFQFVPDQGFAANNPGAFDFWNLREERTQLEKVFLATPADSFIALQFIRQEFTQQTNTAIFVHDYVLTLKHTRASRNIPTEFQGRATFSLEQNETGSWAIYRWEDSGSGQDPTWSRLKASSF
jgi:hypothetical protein